MSFKDDLQRLSIQVNERKDYITNEEMTKQSLIIPFLQTMGFDIFNPLEIRPEYTADFGNKKGEKVDYALFKNSEPIIFIEAKSINENLDNHNAQLSRYFNAVTEVKLAILTNGIEYKFFTDLDANNIMDEKPFLKIDVTNLKDSDIETLSKFKKENFNSQDLITYAEELVYASFLNDALKDLLQNPSDEFIRFLIKDFSSSRITSNVIERFRPVVKKAVSKAVLDIVSKGLYQGDEKNESVIIEASAEVATTENKDSDIAKKAKKQIVTTDDELSSFEMIKNILDKNNRTISNVNYKDTTNYFSIYNQNINKWFVRLNLDATNKHIMTKLDIPTAESLSNNFKVDIAPKGIGESRIYIDSFKDIDKLEELIIAAFDKIDS
ncbi:type I restriction enzyme HsdR N-terminal domain-containing protein [Clostridium phage CWou-2020a]|uniref:DNA polymerase III subunit epsilon n=1 Tax=Clostridium botulinum C/D str. DC5 TaxID=1443128 RepID=A0A0A0I5J7_CLOBO|nr:type I restriction endonuclease [Clostridium botulinum]QPW59442.1 type I restriction enzyme HsdR N-terminal domain-containing protein [Clostridium phage CWou-2020a]KGM96107.1 DNA polymerase III subunit epsilon [Clostridium botulinum C/D str. DC5]KOC54171.1 DNA polymerase III subunit epsilon [Clostridium botulinum]KOC56515.1 DNA polymerase III subunit epsilon [Clostridium botulinum]MCD3234278.1 DNA polymerase III subunit epsilon [Clostridium botulinum D/C]